MSAIHLAQEFQLEPLFFARTALRQHVLDGVVDDVVHRHGRGADRGPLVRAGQEAGREQLVAALPLRGLDGDEAGQVLVLGAQPVECPGTHAWPREGERSRKQLEHGRSVVDALSDHRADHAQIVRASGDLGEQLADGNAAFAAPLEFPGGAHQAAGLLGIEGQRALDRQGLAVVAVQAGFRIEGVDVRDTAVHEQEDDSLGPGSEVRPLAGQRPATGRPSQQVGLLQ